MSTTITTPPTSQPNPHRIPLKSRRAYARAAVFSAFRPRDARAINYDGFQDRRPCDAPHRLGDIAAGVVGNAGQAALDHWIREAARTTGAQRDEAIRISREIAEMLGIPWTEILSEAAA